MMRSSGGGLWRRGSGEICGGTELERSSNGGGDLGLGFARRRLRLGEAKGVVQALFIGLVGDPWRADQGAAWGGVRRPDSLSPCRPRGRKTTPTDGARLSAAERRGRTAPRWAGNRRSWAGGRKTGPGENGLKGKKKKRGKGEGIGLGQNRKGEREGERRERFFFSF